MRPCKRRRPDLEKLECRQLLTVSVVPLAFTATEGQAYSGPVGYFTSGDPAPQSPGNYTASITWGDGNTGTGTISADPSVPGRFDVSGSNTYAEEGQYPVAVTVNDLVDSSSDTGSAIANVTDAPLTASSMVVKPTEGAAFTGTVATFTDADPGGTASDYTATIDWGDGHESFGVVAPDPAGGFAVTGTSTYSLAGSYPVTVVISDAGGSTATARSSAVVADSPLLAVAAPISAVEGQALKGVILATFTDGGGAQPSTDYAVTVDWGDGSPLDTSTGVVGQAGGNLSVSASHTYTQEGAYSAKVTITDETAIGTVPMSAAVVMDPVTVVDAPLAATTIGPLTAAAGTPMAGVAIATFSDSAGPDAVGNYAAQIDWGDGSAATPATITASGLTFTVSGTHTFSSPGSFPGRVTVRDLGGATITADFTTYASPLALTWASVDPTEGVPVTDATWATLQTSGGPDATAGLYTATINWGDLSPPTPASITGGGSVLDVNASHVFAESGTYNVRVVVGVPGNPNLVTDTAAITVADVPIVLTGDLNPSSDSGASRSDHITDVAQPSFSGTSEPGSVVQLFDQQAGGSPVLIGQTTADSSGAWSITSGVALPDGTNQIVATAVDRNGVTRATTKLAPVVVATHGPKVVSVFFDRLHGQVDLTFQAGPAGLLDSTLVDASNYSFSKVNLARQGLNLYKVSGVSMAPGGNATTESVVITINGGRPIHGGSYNFVIRSAAPGGLASGVQDVAGNPLDGEFYRYFPSGNNVPGGDFRVRLVAIHHKIFPPETIFGRSTPVTPPGTRPRTVYIPTQVPGKIINLGHERSRRPAISRRLSSYPTSRP
jgi:hypothetical protein